MNGLCISATDEILAPPTITVPIDEPTTEYPVVRQKSSSQFSHVEISTPEQLLGDGWRGRMSGSSATHSEGPTDDAVSETNGSNISLLPKHVAMAWALRLRRLGNAVKNESVGQVVANAGLADVAELGMVLETMGLVLASNGVVSGVLSLDGHAGSRAVELVDAKDADLVSLVLQFDRKLRRPGQVRDIGWKRAMDEVFKQAKEQAKKADLLVPLDPAVPVMLALALADSSGRDGCMDQVLTVQAVEEAGGLWRNLLVPEVQRRRSIRTRDKEPVSYAEPLQFEQPIRKKARIERLSKPKQKSGTSMPWCSSGKQVSRILASLGMINEINEINGQPSLEQIQRKSFVPLVFRETHKLPSFWLISPASKEMSSMSSTKLDLTTDTFPQPVQFDSWMDKQRELWDAWKTGHLEIKGIQMNRLVQNCLCVSRNFRQIMCRNCVTRQADQPCLYRDIRVVIEIVFTIERDSVTRYIYAPAFASAEPLPLKLRDVNALSCERGDLDAWMAFYCAQHAAPLLIKRLERLLELAEDKPEISDGVEYQAHLKVGCSSQPCIVRPPAPFNRQLCDVCRGEVFGLYYVCCYCMREICQVCFDEWDDSDIDCRFVAEANESALVPAVAQCCSTRRILRAKTRHMRKQQMRFLHWPAEDLQRVANHVRAIMADASALGMVDASGQRVLEDEDTLFWRRIEDLRHSRTRSYAYEPWDLAPLYVDAGELTLGEFSRLWARGVVVVVRGLLDKLQGDKWTPYYWITQLGSEQVTILDCARSAEPVGDGLWQLREFFRLFDGPDDVHRGLFEDPLADEAAWRKRSACVERGILKIKDWPPTESFSQRLPLHFQCFMDALPFKPYTQPGGKLNMAARLTPECLPPDLGPKMYCAYGSSDAKGGFGTTNLHCDMADAVNIMAYAAGNRSDQAAAVWDIFPDAHMPNVRQFVREHTATGRAAVDVIHDQTTYLTKELRGQMHATHGSKASAFRVHQNPGDAVFVPAGCAHQVCNFANAVKIAVDFVSPERVRHCDALAGEFQRLMQPHPRSDDKLQLASILWWAVAEKDSSAGAAVAIEIESAETKSIKLGKKTVRKTKKKTAIVESDDEWSD
ncbi:hypothetical protein LPJ64_005363 [Coemansia asiatica]|uniref:JmjC domain-containing protein n=1 Tax=Coemansia asiatica TaxID=1052880 RepID=A0A9W8CI84_9FUNG|nr:hypothetical protein LPJ64_005363 [Coemansia asiatica]